MPVRQLLLVDIDPGAKVPDGRGSYYLTISIIRISSFISEDGVMN